MSKRRLPPVPEFIETKGGKKKRFMVMKRTKDPIEIDVGRGRRKFWKDIGGKSDMLYVDSESEARDIDALYGRKGTGEVWVHEQGNFSHDRTYKEDGVHNYFRQGAGVVLRDSIKLEDDPNWEEYSPGKWRRTNVLARKRKARLLAEVEDAEV
jgi:hypothetical protein